MASGRERATSERTLVCPLQAVQGHRTIVELRNESSAAGLIDNVDGFMNISMSDVKFSKQNGQRSYGLSNNVYTGQANSLRSNSRFY